MSESASRPMRALMAVMLALVTVAVYWPVSQHEFIRYDDNAYLWENGVVLHGLSLSNVKWAFTTMVVCNWHPLTWLSHMLDCTVFGLENPGGHHMVNVAFHALNAVALFLMLNFMTGKSWRSAMVAALFALHPLHVESVAWVAERKDVLSTLFGLLSIWCYALYARRVEWKWYALSLVCFVLSLMAKPMLVTLPCLLLLMDVWPLKRFWILNWGGGFWIEKTPNPESKIHPPNPKFRLLLIEKLPFLVLSIASSAVTIHAQTVGGAVYSLDLLPMHRRVANAVVSYASYLCNMVWPMDLAVMYPLPKEVSPAAVMVAAGVLIVVSAVVGVLSRKRPWLLIGWLWYLGTLVPVIGLLQVGLQSMADRYTYVPLIGLFIMLAWSVPELSRLARWQAAVVAGACAVILGALSWGTLAQLTHWRTSETLFRRTLAVTEENFVAHNLLGHALEAQGRMDEAMDQYREAIRLHGNFPAAHSNLGNVLMKKKDFEGAIAEFRFSLKLIPDSWLGQQNLGAALVETGQFEEAITHFREALRVRPDFPEAHLGLGRSLSSLGRMKEAMPEFETVLRENEMNVEAHLGLGVALASQGRYEDAIVHFERAQQLEPDNVDAHVRLGLARAFQNRFDEAIAQFQAALRLQPEKADVQGYLELAVRKRDEANKN